MSGLVQKAKAKVEEIISKDGQHDTTVHEHVAPAVQNEVVHSDHTEKAREVYDVEKHQDHYHTSVQPIKDTEIKPTQHSDNILPTQERTITHGNKERDLDIRANEAAKFNDTRVVQETETAEQKASVGSERVHHHVHETIQPVVQKTTIAPSVTHTVVPVHQVEHNEAQHHATSALPAVSMNEFQKAGGVLGGRGERQDAFEGEPRGIDTLGKQTETSATSNRDSALGRVEDKLTGHHSDNATSGTRI